MFLYKKTNSSCLDFLKVYVVCKSKIFVIGEENAGRGNKMLEAWRRRERLGNVFAGLGDNSAH